MVEESKKTGNCYYYEPLRSELNDTFGVMKNVTPDSVFSNIKGLQVNPNSDKSGENAETDNGGEEEAQLVAQTSDESKEKKKTPKSMSTINILTVYKLDISYNLLNYEISQQFYVTNTAGRQPVVQQVKTCFDDVKEMYRSESDRIDNKIDALLQIQRERLELEKERLAFECEKAGLPGNSTAIFL